MVRLNTNVMGTLSNENGRKLLSLARATIAGRLGKIYSLPKEMTPEFLEVRGTFVTLKKGTELRGCIGNIEPVRNIEDGIKSNAISAAFHDHRFSPLTIEELAKINISISILTEANELKYTDAQDLCAQLRPGIDGVILRQGRASATFLPQVWEQLPQAEQFLSHLCLKAGLSKDAWKDDLVEISVYQVQNFAEEK